VARVWSGRLKLPSTAEMQEWEKQRLEETGEGKRVHLLGYPDDAGYINFLHDWAMSASPSLHSVSAQGRLPTATTGGGGRGKEPPYWGEEECWVRERTPLIKKATRELEPRRRAEVKTLRELGFDFERWKCENSVDDGRGGEGGGD
jgi:hypothetical protein